MHRARSSICALVLFALLAASVLSGCASSESESAGAATGERSGVIATVLGGLEHGDDEAEIKEAVDQETTSEERQELREEAEAGRQPEEEQEQGEAEPSSEGEQGEGS